jgi:3'-phosphoadenosine 5'-phosphosulfate sulfotransferase (PAPS reductase)/FAD synthetase
MGRFDMISKSTDGKTRVLSLSYGKDSMACLGALEQLQWPLDRIVTADVWATDTIPADLPPMVKFKDYADKAIKERYGIEVEHYFSSNGKNKISFQTAFYKKRIRGERAGETIGWPRTLGAWCNSELKIRAIKNARKSYKNGIEYVGIAADEPNRFHTLTDTKLSPLVELGWTESDCRTWCEQNGLLSPIYTQATRGGCWFCHNQGVQQLRLLRRQYPDLWALLLKWDSDSPVTFHADGHTVHDFDRRFALEDEGLIAADDKVFRWSMLDEELNYRWF